MVWAVLSFLVVAVTKYLTSVRLRHMRERGQQYNRATDDLKRLLAQSAAQEEQLQAQTDELTAKIAALNNVVSTLEKSLRRSSASS